MKGGPQDLVSSPPRGDSTLITSAPRSDITIVAKGPASILVMSRILIPARGLNFVSVAFEEL